jgi:hypothetical protein
MSTDAIEAKTPPNHKRSRKALDVLDSPPLVTESPTRQKQKMGSSVLSDLGGSRDEKEFPESLPEQGNPYPKRGTRDEGADHDEHNKKDEQDEQDEQNKRDEQDKQDKQDKQDEHDEQDDQDKHDKQEKEDKQHEQDKQNKQDFDMCRKEGEREGGDKAGLGKSDKFEATQDSNTLGFLGSKNVEIESTKELPQSTAADHESAFEKNKSYFDGLEAEFGPAINLPIDVSVVINGYYTDTDYSR